MAFTLAAAAGSTALCRAVNWPASTVRIQDLVGSNLDVFRI